MIIKHLSTYKVVKQLHLYQLFSTPSRFSRRDLWPISFFNFKNILFASFFIFEGLFEVYNTHLN